MALIDKLKAIADAVREKTGGTDALTLEQMVTEIEGIETGNSTEFKYEYGTFTFDADNANGGSISFPHTLGVAPTFVLVWTDDFNGATEAPFADYNSWLGFLYIKDFMGLPQRLTSSATATNPMCIDFTIAKGEIRLGTGNTTSGAYGIQKLPTDTTFYPPIQPNRYWRTGVTYKYFIAEGLV